MPVSISVTTSTIFWNFACLSLTVLSSFDIQIRSVKTKFAQFPDSASAIARYQHWFCQRDLPRAHHNMANDCFFAMVGTSLFVYEHFFRMQIKDDVIFPFSTQHWICRYPVNPFPLTFVKISRHMRIVFD